MKKITIVFLTILFAIQSDAQVLKQKLISNWVFQKHNAANWYPAKVPGEVHVDLLNNKLIEDPFYRDNEKKVKWIEKENWDYKTTFDISSQAMFPIISIWFLMA